MGRPICIWPSLLLSNSRTEPLARPCWQAGRQCFSNCGLTPHSCRWCCNAGWLLNAGWLRSNVATLGLPWLNCRLKVAPWGQHSGSSWQHAASRKYC